MRIVRYQSKDGAALYGMVEDDAVIALQGDIFGAWSAGGRVCNLDEARLLAPCQPSKIVCVGKNYLDHAREMQSDVPEEPLIFLKPPTAVIAHLDAIVYPTISQKVHHEGELAVVIGRACKHVEPVHAKDYVLGYTCGNDVTARDLQHKDGQWTRGKGFDTFLPLGPFIVTDLDVTKASIETRVNGQVKQHSKLTNMVFGVEFVISHVSQVMTLLPGDVVMTGTPSGVGPIVPGDVVEVEITGIGVLRNHVMAAKH
jgi:2-keto-4-pentenoate hydratase/2-oxohepta-3-ene-1,7-dioic acid hydratase in catechol pathway